MYLPNHERIILPSCIAGCGGSTEGSLGRAVVIVAGLNCRGPHLQTGAACAAPGEL